MSVNMSATTRDETNSNELCLLCGEFGCDNELWFQCINFLEWVHSECSSADTADNFICDFCHTA